MDATLIDPSETSIRTADVSSKPINVSTDFIKQMDVFKFVFK